MEIVFFLIITYMFLGFASPAIFVHKFDIFSPSIFLFVSYIIPLCLGSILYFNMGLMQNNEEAFILLVLVVLVMTTSYIVSYIIFLHHKNLWDLILEKFTLNIYNSIVGKRIKIFLTIGLLIYGMLLALLLAFTGLDPITSPLWFRIRASHDFGVLYGLYQFLPIYIIIYAYYYNHIKKSFYTNFLYNIIIIFAFITSLLSGSRGMIVQIIFTIFILKKIFKQNKISLISASLFGIFSLLFFVGYQIYRISGTLDILSLIMLFQDISFENTMLWEFLFRYDVLFNLYKVLNEISNGNISYLFGSSFIDTITILVPRILYPDKPNFSSMELQKYFTNSFGQGALDFSSSYMMAEAFLNLHLIGVFMYSVIWGIFMVGLDKSYYKALKNKKVASGYLILYLPICLYLPFLQDGFYGMFFQQILIAFLFAIFQLIFLKIKY